MTNRPNILYIHSHDTGRQVEPYGAPVQTPNLMRLAAEGVLFRNAFSCAPTCSPSRAALLTGQMPATAGMVTNVGTRGGRLHDYRKHLLHTLRANGYATALAGLQHVAADSAIIGYDQVLGTRQDGLLAAVDYLADPPAQPFFLSVGFHETHRRKYHFADDPLAGPHLTAPLPGLPDTPATRADAADFYACVERLDEKIGRVLDAVDQNDLAEGTLVICTTDHGPAFPGMKSTLYDGGIGVMLIMRGPNGVSGGRIVDGLVSHLDIFPTLCDSLEIPPLDWLQGRSFLQLVTEGSEAVNDAVYAQINYHAAYEAQRCVRTERYKYIRRFHDYPKVMLSNIDNSPTKDVLVNAGLGNREQAREELYDLLFDPSEQQNRIVDPGCQEVLDQLRQRLRDHMKDSRDPLLGGPIPMPSGGRFNRPTDASPHEPPTLTAADSNLAGGGS